jgi:hypothetical protein
MFIKTRLALAALAFAAAGAAVAAPAAYPTPGSENPATYTFTAAATGDLKAYFVGTGAAYTEDLGLLVNGADTGIYGLSNHSTAAGTALDFGNVTAGDTLTFFIRVQTTGDVYYSDPSLNVDDVNHIYSNSYAGGDGLPAGTYVGFEDLPSGGDFNYTDEQFVFTNVSSTSVVPEPANVALMLAGLGLLGAAARRRAR